MTNPPPQQTLRGPGLLAESRQGSFRNSMRRIPSSLFRSGSSGAESATARKDKSVRRKGLASILGWGRAETPPPVPALPSLLAGQDTLRKAQSSAWGVTEPRTAAPVPSPVSVATEITDSRSPPWSRSLRGIPPTTERFLPEYKVRPSCPPDPFERADNSVRVIDRAFPTPERAPHVKAIEAERRTPKIVFIPIDDADTNDDLDKSWVESLSNFDVPPLALQFDTDQSMHVPSCGSSVPRTLKALPQLPQEHRFASLARPLEAMLDPINETAEPAQPATVRRETTKSRVWSILTGKARKAPAQPIRTVTDVKTTNPHTTLCRQPVPTLHVTKPSTATTPATPPKLQTTPHRDPDSAYHTSQITHRSLPKRKSLTGLFGVSMKKGAEQAGSPKGTPRIKRTILSIATPKRTPSKKAATPKSPAMLTPLRDDNLFQPEDDTSPDTAAFYSRFGNTGFNPEGSGAQADVTISDTTSATMQLARFLATVDTTSPLTVRGTESTLLPSTRSATARKAAPVTTARKFETARHRPAPSHRSPVASLFTGMRSKLSTSAPSSPFRLAPTGAEEEIKLPGDTTIPEITLSAPIPAEWEDLSLPLEAIAQEVPQTVPSVTPRVGGLPPAPPSDRKVDRLAQRAQQGVPPPQVIHSAPEVPATEAHASFDFTKEMMSLERGDHNSSFINALHKALSQEPVGSPLKEYSPSTKTKTPSTIRTVRSARRSPSFQGDPAFQKFVEQTKKPQGQAPPLLGEPPRFELPPLPSPMLYAPLDHSRNESFATLASISSLGMPLGGRSLTHDYTNYFEDNYTGIDDEPPLRIPIDSLPRYDSGVSLSRHIRQRSVSGSSMGSLAGAELSYVSESIRLSSRPAFVTRHHREPSADAVLGRPDWSSRRRVASNASSVLPARRRVASNASSVISVRHLSRPTVGERMFERDERVKLSSFHEGESRSWSMSSFATYDASGEAESGDLTLEDEVFGSTNRMSKFFIKSRPLSGLSLASEAEGPDDTFSGLSKALEEVRAQPPAPYGAAHLRPVAPLRPIRNRPEPLKLSDYSMDTPGLDTCYTSADESSLFSWDARSSRMSNPPLSSSMSASFSSFFTHTRQHSSIASVGVKVEATILEENSQSTLKSLRPASPLVPERDNFNYWDETEHLEESVTASWIQWQREAEDVCHQNKLAWVNSAMTDEEMIDFHQPSTSLEIEMFLAESKAKYKPLEQLPLAHVVRRRQVSLTRQNCRASASPYGAPVPPLETRFRNKKLSMEAGESRPVSALLLEFAREHIPPEHPRSVTKHAYRDSTSPSSQGEFRQSVTSSVRRRNLGWGRHRRPSMDDESRPTISPPKVRSPPKSPPKLVFSSEDMFRRPPKATRREKQPTFLCFSPPGASDVTDEDIHISPSPSPSPSPKKAPLTLMARPAPPRRRTVDVRVTSMGSPVNLSSPLEPTPLAGRKTGSRLSYEPGYSPLRMRPLRSVPVKEAMDYHSARSLGSAGGMYARPALQPSMQPNLNAHRTKSSPQLRTTSLPPDRFHAKRSAPKPRRKPQDENAGYLGVPQTRPLYV